jgi:hypothetical protein
VLIRLDVPFADVRAGELSLTLGAAPEPAVEVLRLSLNGFDVELRLLGCSHQALVGEISETVACRPGAAGPLPASASAGGYAFRARTTRHDPAGYARRARRAITAAAHDEAALVGIFPGPAHAFTAVRVRPLADGITWTTWHGYPQTGELVLTTSCLRGAP